jgi:ribosomal protein L32
MWLRYRSPARDASALGPAGHPALAFTLAAVLVVAGAAAEPLLPAGAWLVWLGFLDGVAVILLRRAIHLGLLQESLELEIGPELACPNCGAATARHTFCQNCGISLQALPKSRHPERGDGRREVAG